MAYVAVPPPPYKLPIREHWELDSLFSQSLHDENWVELSDAESSETDSQFQTDEVKTSRAAPRPKRCTRKLVAPKVQRTVICKHQHRACFEVYHNAPHPSAGLFSPNASICPILEDLRISFTPFGFACHTHKTLIPPSILHRHIIGSHDVSQNSSARKELIAHLLHSHHMAEETKLPEPTGDLTEPIPGLQVQQGVKCPVEGCPGWYSSQRSLSDHYSNHHAGVKGQHFKFLTKRYIMRPYFHIVDRKDDLSRRVFVLHAQWTPNLSFSGPSGSSVIDSTLQAVYHRNTTAAPLADFLLEIAWPQYLAKFDDPSRSLLRQLVQIRSSADVNAMLPGASKRLEKGILTLRKLFMRYLVDVQRYRCATNDEVVQVLLHGTRAHFNPLARVSSYMTYTVPVMQCLSMMLRYKHAARTGKGKIPSFVIPATGGEVVAVTALYDYIVTNKERSGVILMQLLHNFAALLVRHKITSVEVMACPSDISLCLGSLVDNDHFRVGNIITVRCAILQHSWFAIIIQWARIEASGKMAFFPHNPDHFNQRPSDSTLPQRTAMPSTASSSDGPVLIGDEIGSSVVEDEDDFGEPEEEEDIEEDQDEDAMENMDFQKTLPGLPGHNLNGGHVEALVSDGFFSADSENTGPGQRLNTASVLGLLSENRAFVHPSDDTNMGFTTPYTRFKTLWAKVASAARLERTEYGFIFSDDGQSVMIPDARGVFHCVQYLELGSLTRQLIHQFSSAVQTILSDTHRWLYNDFSQLQLTDDLGRRESIFHQPANEPQLQPMIKVAYDQLVGPAGHRSSVFNSKGSINTKAVQNLMEKEQDLLCLLNASFQLSCGVPPRSFQLKSLRHHYDPITGAQRNLFMVWGALTLANPAAKQRGETNKECLWALPSSLVTPLLFYLGVLRPAFCNILRLVRGSVPEHETYIFVHAYSKHDSGFFWSGPDVNASLRKRSSALPVSLSSTLLRNLTTGMLRKFFPSLTELHNLPDSLLDQQAQHHRRTGNTHYGRDFDLPRSLSMTIDRARGYITTSRALQAIYGLGTLDEGSLRALSNSHFFASRAYELVAFKEARFQILSLYSGPADGRPLVQETLNKTPYMALVGDVIGDGALRSVMHVLSFGTSLPSVGSAPPPAGYSAETAGCAAALIIRALNEWSSGSHCDLLKPADVNVAEYFKGCEADATAYFKKLATCHPQSWTALSNDVHYWHRPAPGFLSYIPYSWDGKGVPSTSAQDESHRIT
ncbi:uncharacterized protein HD556DRAFT_1450695 [Suillus plorans]|uniref:C2H2-type domain-containing protein n=1 Tax=Suillus plorans TaxID=116603 RepID=A0A9P7ABA1_9AGAM|nr:uncharacterized protein HD556DRAFT_1450695 [Suillus plorans]KAG1785473.1 hypothetical protein HD556DRAFT_1450695 [Suillus plorans]